jgi:cupin 2 domain-containing protein
MVTAGSLLADIPDRLEAERFDQLLKVANIRIERIVSTGQTTPPGEWFDQAWDEWVLLISGAAEIILAEEDVPRLLKPGDYLFIPAHVRHRVTWTNPDPPTIWLAISYRQPCANMIAIRMIYVPTRLQSAPCTIASRDALSSERGTIS